MSGFICLGGQRDSLLRTVWTSRPVGIHLPPALSLHRRRACGGEPRSRAGLAGLRSRTHARARARGSTLRAGRRRTTR